MGGSLGRGAGDRWSDLDAGIGVVEGESLTARRDDAVAAASEFASVAGTLVQTWGAGFHCVFGYADGRQLSLVVAEASMRSGGRPPESISLLDRSARLATLHSAERWTPTAETVSEWAFLAWIAVGDTARHALRGKPWRALRTLAEGRELIMQLWAAQHGLSYPAYGSVTVENAGLDAPPRLADTHPYDLEPDRLLSAAEAMIGVLSDVSDHHPGLAESVRRRVSEVRSSRSW